MRFWNRFMWALIGGFGYCLARFLFHYFQSIGG